MNLFIKTLIGLLLSSGFIAANEFELIPWTSAEFKAQMQQPFGATTVSVKFETRDDVVAITSMQIDASNATIKVSGEVLREFDGVITSSIYLGQEQGYKPQESNIAVGFCYGD